MEQLRLSETQRLKVAQNCFEHLDFDGLIQHLFIT